MPHMSEVERMEDSVDVPMGDDEGEFAPLSRDAVIEDTQSMLTQMIEEAIQHYQEHLEPDQIDATNRYHGRISSLPGEAGRSQVISTDVRDSVLAVLPSLLRMFFSHERIVEFRPRGPEDIADARQRTEYINYIVREDNDGFLEFLSWLKDGLVRRVGFVKWWWDDKVEVSEERYTGLSETQVAALMATEGVEIEITGRYTVGGLPDSPELYDARIRYTRPEGLARFESVPTDELVWSPRARKFQRSPLLAHVREVPADDLIKMGIDEDLVEKHKGQALRRIASGNLADVRRFDEGAESVFEDTKDDASSDVVFAEAYARVDADGDKITELRCFRCVGPSYEIANFDEDGLPGEVVDEVPFAYFTPDPEPHTIVGLSFDDLLKEIQTVKSLIKRGTLDSLAQAIEPQLEVVQNQVNMQDLLNPEVSGIIRVRQPGMLREIKHTFVGPDTLPMLDYYDQVMESRVGRHRGALGLDADTLQSSTKAAVAATLSAAQQRAEMIARIFAETGVKQLFRGLQRLVMRHQDRARVVRLRGEYVEVDPRTWDAPMDVTVSVALGAGSTEDKMQMLALIAQKQEQLLQMNSPLVTRVEYRNALARFVESAQLGWHAEEFFRPWGPQEEQAAQEQAAQQPPPPDPTMMLVQIEQMKAQVQQMKVQQELQMEQQRMIWENDRERDKLARETALKQQELEMKHSQVISDSVIAAQIERDRHAQDADLKREIAQAKLQMQAQQAAQPTQEG